jgi:hypothetical protein
MVTFQVYVGVVVRPSILATPHLYNKAKRFPAVSRFWIDNTTINSSNCPTGQSQTFAPDARPLLV